MSDDQRQPPKADILIVDDTPANLQLLSKMLSEKGYRVRPVPNGSMALSVAKLQPPDLVLLDIRMPEMDGYTVCEHLKADVKTRDLPIIFISALDATHDKVKAFQAGGQDYITKPFQIEEVIARVETHLALRDLQRQLQVTNAKMEMELALAGEVQTSFLPRELPNVPGWQIEVTLLPSRETSGDYYDFILLPNGMLGILVADVVDKGAGAALFMAMSWTLLRTYAKQYPLMPEKVLKAVNHRIIEDTTTRMFVTVFFGILEPNTGELIYSNAGHCPPLLLKHCSGQEIRQLMRTGVPLGIFHDQTWKRGSVFIDHADILVLYSDGITEAQNLQKQCFGENGLRNIMKINKWSSAKEVQNAILGDLHRFVGDTPQSDDIVLTVIFRE